MAQNPQQGHLENHPEYLWKTISAEFMFCSVLQSLLYVVSKSIEQKKPKNIKVAIWY